MSGFNPGTNGTLKATNKPAALIELAQLLAAEEQLMNDQTGPNRVQMMVDVQAQAIVIVATLPFQASPIGNGLSIVPTNYLAPPPSPTPSAADVVYTSAQSSEYGGNATYATLTDGNGTTGTFNYPNGQPGSIQASFPYSVLVTAIQVGGGVIDGVGGVAGRLNGSKLQSSIDNTNWTDLLTVTGVTDTGMNQFMTFTLAAPITTQYVRLYRADGHTATTELKFT